MLLLFILLLLVIVVVFVLPLPGARCFTLAAFPRSIYTNANKHTHAHTHTSASTPLYIARIQPCVIYTARTLRRCRCFYCYCCCCSRAVSLLLHFRTQTSHATSTAPARSYQVSSCILLTQSPTHTHTYTNISALTLSTVRERQKQCSSECSSALFVLPLPASTGDQAQPHARNVEQQLNSHCAVRKPRCRRCHSGCCAPLRTIHNLECVVKSRSIWMPFAKNSFISVALGQRQPTACERHTPSCICMCV